jgi:flagellar biosynthesis/type III secretory pathway protein FliH
VNTVIKGAAGPSGEVASVRWRVLKDEAAGVISVDPPDPRIAELDARIKDLTRAIEDAHTRHAQALAAVREEARREAEEAHRRDDAEALALVEAGVDAALEIARAQIAQLEDLALILCETALETAFGEREDYRERTTRAIERQLAGLRRDLVLSVTVSAKDFPDDAALTALAARLGPVILSVEPSLDAGQARVDLRLGRIELSLPEYWSALKARLASMACADGGR